MSVPCTIVRLGLIDYMEAFDLQKRLAEEVKEGRSEGWLLLLEHPHTYTFGRAGDPNNLRLSEEELERIGARVCWVDRGGDITYHGPGQLICYPIVDLHDWGEGPRWFVRVLEDAIIDALAALGVQSERSEGRPGVWAGNEKLAAIGLHISQGVTTHGLALNVDPDLSYYQHIVSCGLADAGATSAGRILGRPVGFDEAADAMAEALVRHLSLEPRTASADEVLVQTSAG
jgi:lipoate-protein ligase B